MEGLLLWIGGLALFFYGLIPLQIRFSQKMSAQPQFQPIDLTTVPEPAAHYLWSCQQAMEAEGFATVAHLSWENSAPNVFPIITLFMNRAAGVKAIAGVFYVVSAEGVKLTTRYVEFITRYGNGDVLQTSNAKSPGVFQHGPEQKTLRLPEMQNPHALYAVHCRRMEQRRGDAIEALPAPGTEIVRQQERMVEDYEEQVKFGRLYLDRSLGMYRPTWPGAYLMTWSQLPPMKDLRRAQERRKSQAALKELAAAAPQSQVY